MQEISFAYICVGPQWAAGASAFARAAADGHDKPSQPESEREMVQQDNSSGDNGPRVLL